MTEPKIASVVRVASSPQQAKVLAAVLQAEGIPAYVEGESLADEFAVSRRLLGTAGTRILVPTASLEAARNILAACSVPEAELEAQALAAVDPEQAATAAPAVRPGGRRGIVPLFLPWMLAALFGALWLEARSAVQVPVHPFHDYENTGQGQRVRQRSDGRILQELIDLDGDGHFERMEFLGRGARSTAEDNDGDGCYERLTERRAGRVYQWVDQDADGLVDSCEVVDGRGTVTQVLRMEGERGFVLEER